MRVTTNFEKTSGKKTVSNHQIQVPNGNTLWWVAGCLGWKT